MSERKDEKWLDEELQRAVDGTTPIFDAPAWKQKHRAEYKVLLSRKGAAKMVGWGWLPRSPLSWRLWWGKPGSQTRLIAFGNPTHLAGPGPWLGGLAVAAAIVAAAGLLLSRGGHEPGGVVVEPPVAQSPAKMLSVMSLRGACQRGGLEALDQQLQETLDTFGPRPLHVSMQELSESVKGS